MFLAIFTKVVMFLFGFLAFSFIAFRKLKEDYISSHIFSTTFFVLFSVLILGYLTLIFFKTWFFWSIIAGIFAGLILGEVKFKMRFWEVFDVFVKASLVWSVFILIPVAIFNFNAKNLLNLAVSCLVTIIYYYFDLHYKKFIWYKSGRVGFAGLATVGVYFLIRSCIGISVSDMLFFGVEKDAIISGVVAFVAFLNLYNLSRLK